LKIKHEERRIELWSCKTLGINQESGEALTMIFHYPVNDETIKIVPDDLGLVVKSA
jgi:hypothetical protein